MSFDILYNGYVITRTISYSGSPQKPAGIMYFNIHNILPFKIRELDKETNRFVTIEEAMYFVTILNLPPDEPVTLI